MVLGLSTLQTWIGGAILSLSVLSGAYAKGRHDGAERAEVAFQASTAAQWKNHAQALQEQQRVSSALAAKTLTLSNDYARNLTALVVESQRVLDGVRSRPPRPPADLSRPGADPRPDTARLGATGAQLYREDSRFLVGEAARADEIRLALIACTTQYNLVRDARVPPL